MAVKKSERLRFTREDDLILLREVISKNPYEENDRWKVITERVGVATGKHFTLRAVREHLELLLKHWIRENRQNLKKSGIEEEYTEKEQLLQEIEDLQREHHRHEHKSAKKNNSNLQKLGTQARDRALTNIYPPNTIIIEDLNLSPILESEQEIISVACPTDISENIVPSSLPSTSESDDLSKELSSSLACATPLSTNNSMRRTAVRGLKNSTLKFLEEKHKKEIELEEYKLQLEEKKLEFEKEKFEFEKKERETKLQLEKEERQQNMAAADQQRKLMEMLLHLLNKSKE